MKGRSQVLLLGVLAVVGLTGCAGHRHQAPNDPTSRGISFIQQGRFQDAVAPFREAAQSKPSDPALHYQLGNALMNANDRMIHYPQHHVTVQALYRPSKEDLVESITEYRRAIQLSPGQFEYHEMLTEALAMQGDVTGAIAEARTTIHLLPKKAWVLIQPPNGYRDNAQTLLGVYQRLAIELVAAKQYPEAIKQYREALMWDPTYNNVRLDLADTLNKNGQRAEARAEWQAVAAAHDSWSKTALQRLRQYPPSPPW